MDSEALRPANLWSLLRQTVSEWQEDKASRLAAALAYYTVFSLAPVLVIALAVAGLVFGDEAARGALDDQLAGLMGREGADFVAEAVEAAREPRENALASLVGVVLLLFGASGVFGQLHDALNTIWEVAPKKEEGLLALVRSRFVSFTMVLGVGFLLLVSLVLSALLAGIASLFGGGAEEQAVVWSVVHFLASFAVVTVLFAMIYKVLPDVELAWSDVWIGALMTSLLFTVGKWLIGLYLGNSSVGSAFGAAGSLAVVLVWVYYSAQILFLGAEFTQVYAHRYGSGAVPAPQAEPVTEEKRAQEGLPRREPGSGRLARGGAARPAGLPLWARAVALGALALGAAEALARR
jgi:membrane protein